MQIKKIHHIGIIIRDLEEAKKLYGDIFGLRYDHEEESDVWNVRAAFYHCGDTLLELMQPIGPGVDQDFLDQTGGGIHHICYETDDIHGAMDIMKKELRVMTDQPLPGNSNSQIFFLDPKTTANIETEFLELP